MRTHTFFARLTLLRNVRCDLWCQFLCHRPIYDESTQLKILIEQYTKAYTDTSIRPKPSWVYLPHFSLVHLQGIIRTNRVGWQNKTGNITNHIESFTHIRQLQLKPGNTNQLYNWRESDYIMLQSSCKSFLKKKFFIFCLNIGSDIEHQRRMSSLPFNTWRTSTSCPPSSCQSRLY